MTAEEKKKKVTEVVGIMEKVVLNKFPEYEGKEKELKACLNGFTYGAQWIQEQQETENYSPWISIEDEQPKEFQYVYTHDKMLTEESIDNYKISQYLGSNRWAQTDGEYETQFTGGIDYWMPIPELKREK